MKHKANQIAALLFAAAIGISIGWGSHSHYNKPHHDEAWAFCGPISCASVMLPDGHCKPYCVTNSADYYAVVNGTAEGAAEWLGCEGSEAQK